MSDLGSPAVKPEVVFAEDLLTDILNGKLRVPRFQRPYVWKPVDMLNLFDSIHRGYPIGSLLVWESGKRVESADQVGPISIAREPATGVSYILDGHQRLATLLGCLRLPDSAPKGTDPSQWRWWVWFDLEKETFTHVPSGEPEPCLLPLRAVLRTTDFLEESRKLQERYRAADQARRYIERAETLAARLKNYKVAVTRIVGGSLDEAVEIFSRLNTKGRSMTLDQMVSALTYREAQGGLNLAVRIDEILEKLRDHHFGNLKRMTVFRTIAAAADKPVHKSEWESIARRLKEDLAPAVDAAETALIAAAEFLRVKIGVPCDELLPYNLQMLMLAEFFRNCRHQTAKHEEILTKWFWTTSLSGWFAGANTTKINDALKEMRAIAADDAYTLHVMPLEDRARPFPNSFDMRSARIRSLLIVLALRKPRSIETGDELAVNGLLAESGNQALVHVFRGRQEGDWMSSPGNRLLADRVPGRSIRDRLRDLPPLFRDRILQSHAISRTAYGALLNGDGRTFVTERARDLQELERAFMDGMGIHSATAVGAPDIDADDDENS